jgi:flagellar P-ring protein precursor FlgI
LLYTPLSKPADGIVYATAQGSISVGGYDFATQTGNRVSKNPTCAGRVPRGGSLVNSLRMPQNNGTTISIFLKNPDFSTANNVTTAINAKFNNSAKAADATEIQVAIPQDKRADMVAFLAELESIPVQTDVAAKVVLNERTGTVVAGSNVIILPATITHGSLNLTIRSYPVISQPGAFSQGKTEVFNNLIPYVQQDSSKVVALQRATTVSEVAAALNSLKVTPRDIISIFQALKEAGALVAELIII